MAIRLLFIGDVHLGRRPDRMAVAGLDPRRLSPAVAWQRAVELAIQDKVAAVVLAGDLVDEERDRFEAYGYLERGVRRRLQPRRLDAEQRRHPRRISQSNGAFCAPGHGTACLAPRPAGCAST